MSISLLIMFDTLLLRPSLHCNTPLHFTILHPTTLHCTSLHFTQPHFTTLIDTSLPLIYTSRPSHLALRIYISYRSISPHITTLDNTVLISKLISKIMNPFTALKNFLPLKNFSPIQDKNNNIWLNMFINVHLLVYLRSIRDLKLSRSWMLRLYLFLYLASWVLNP